MKAKNFVTSSNFAKHSNFIYSEIISNEEFQEKSLTNVYVITKNKNFVWYKVKELNISTNDIIFTNSTLIECLFNDLKNLKSVKNLKIITGQNDRLINHKIVSKIPDCVSELHAVNLVTENSKVNSLPIGLANQYSIKNLHVGDFLEKRQLNKKDKIYINFNESTNRNERTNLKNKFNNYSWATIQNNNLSKKEYLNDLRSHHFVLCPWGNGIDTHRVWETLYSKSIPVVKYHPTYSHLKNLPIIFVNDYEEVTYELLSEKLRYFESQNLGDSYLEIKYWMKNITKKKIEDITNEKIISDSSFFNSYWRKRRLIKMINDNLKYFKFKKFQIKNLFKTN